MQEDYGVYENEDENLLGEDEAELEQRQLEEEDERQLEDARGVTELNAAYDEAMEEKEFYNGFPELDDIYNEKYVEDVIPEGLTEAQEDYYKRGIEAINKINKKYNCNLTFNVIVASLNNYEKSVNKGDRLKEAMSFQIYRVAQSLAVQMQESKVYSTNFSTRQIKNNLLSSFKEISKAVRLYAKIYPEKFEGVGRNAAFTEDGKVRSVFKTELKYRSGNIKGPVIQKFDAETLAESLVTKATKTGDSYFRKYTSPEEAKTALINRVNKIIDGNPETPNTQGERARKLAECVRLLRPLQIKKDNRSIWQFFTNHKVFVAEREMLKECKEQMQRLGLAKEEISKVLHGKSFNDVLFRDGLTAREKLKNPNVKDNIASDELLQIDGLLIPNDEISETKSLSKEEIIVEEAMDKLEIANNEIEEAEQSKILETSI